MPDESDRRTAAWEAYARRERYALDARYFKECFEKGWEAAKQDSPLPKARSIKGQWTDPTDIPI